MKNHLRMEEVVVDLDDLIRLINGSIYTVEKGGRAEIHGSRCAALAIYQFLVGDAEMDELEELVDSIIDHQNNPKLHPLTCGNNSNHTPLVPVIEGEEVVLLCPDCDYKQSYIPYIKKEDGETEN